MNLAVLKTELDTDPLTRGYSGMSDAAAAVDLNTANRTRARDIMTASEVLNSVDEDEYNALIDKKKQLMWNVLHIGELNPFGVEAALMVEVFTAGSATITALNTLRWEAITRGQELGLGRVRAGDVKRARAV